MRKKMLFVSLFTALAMALLTACGADEPKPPVTGDITEKNVSQVRALLEEAGLSNTDVFETWVKESASDAAGGGSGSGGFSDANCRMTVMLLAGDLIRYDSLEESYNGSYLMFDTDAIENDDRYAALKSREGLFTTMFGEMPIPESGFADALPQKWGGHGIRVESDKCAVISIVFKAYDQEEAFVGHTGLLIDCRGSKAVNADYVFVEKLAFGDPFRITEVKDEDELLALLSARPDYTVEDGEPAPVAYKNTERIGELKQ